MENAVFGGVAILETETQRASIKLLDTARCGSME